MYYGNPPLRLDDEALCEVYTVLQLAAPDTGTLEKLRTIGDRFLASRFESSVNNDLLHDDVNDFYWSAIADEMVERAIDALARRHEYDESTGHVKPVYDVGASQEDFFDQCLSDLTEDYVPSENRFLMPVKSNPALRQLPPTMNPEGEAVYEMAGTKAHAEIEYALAAGAAPEAGAAVSYDMANQPTAHEYAVSCGADDIVGVSQGEEVYTMASGVGSADVTYDIGGIGSAMTDTDVVYDMGGAQQRPHGGDAIYDNKARGRPVSEAVYDLGGAGGSSTVDSFKKRPAGRPASEAVYDLGGAGGSSTVDSFKKRPAGRPASEAVYDLGGGGSSSVDDDGAIYDNSPELLESDVVEANAVYDIGSGGEGYLGLGGASTDDAPAQYDVGSSDAMDATYDVGNCATEEDVAVDVTSLEAPTDSEGYLTMSREEPVLVPEVYAKGPTYDLGTGSPIAPIATYELADDMKGDDRPHSRTRSYDNALHDAAA
jgi:hypothetical protein